MCVHTQTPKHIHTRIYTHICDKIELDSAWVSNFKC